MFECYQLILTANEDVSNISLSTEDLVNGTEVIPKNNIRLFFVNYKHLTSP